MQVPRLLPTESDPEGWGLGSCCYRHAAHTQVILVLIKLGEDIRVTRGRLGGCL